MTQNKIFTNTNFILAEKKLLRDVFSWMSAGLIVTALVAYVVTNSPLILNVLMNSDSLSLAGYLTIFAPLVIVLVMSFGFNRIPTPVLLTLYLLYAFAMGASLSFIFLTFTDESIVSALVACAGMFGLMALVGLTTNIDISRIGAILLMALFGVLIATLINIILKSDTFSIVISLVSVVLFCGLTAWDTQKIKNLSVENIGRDTQLKLGLMGALTLYLDFINMFLSALRLFGKRRKS